MAQKWLSSQSKTKFSKTKDIRPEDEEDQDDQDDDGGEAADEERAAILEKLLCQTRNWTP